MTDELLSKWPPIQRKNGFGRIAYGYIMEGGDPKSLVPDPEQVKLINEALDFLDAGHALRTTANWLTEANNGRTISHVGLDKLWKRLRGGDASSARQKKIDRYEELKTKKRTQEQRVKANLGRKLGAEKRRILAAEKRISKMEEAYEERTKSLQEVIDTPANVFTEFESIPEEVDERDVIFKPNEGPQTEFLAASELQVLFGGSAGGGKSYAMLADPMRYFHNPNFRGLLLRRTNDELKELKWKSQMLYPQIFKGAKWSEKSSEWRFPSGATFWLTYLERDEDVLRYQGQSFTWIGVDELTQYATPFAWNYLSSRLRTDDPTLPLFMRATTNPGGPGHAWVKKMFIDPAPRNRSFDATDIETGATLVEPLVFPEGHKQAGQPNPDGGKPLFKRRFIPSSVFDNPYLANTSYIQTLYSLPENERRKLLEGDWSISEGAAFAEFRENIHTCEPFEIPYNWTRFRSCDYGFGSASAVHWFAIDPAFETLYVYRELYTSKKTGEELAQMILAEERKARERITYGVLDSSCWHQRGASGPTIAEAMIRQGCLWRPSDRSQGSRVAGRIRLHELLKEQDLGDRKLPGIVFFNNCRQIITDLPSIPTDPKGTDDIDPRYANDHAYDSIRYGIMSRPRSWSLFDDMQTRNTWRPSDATFGY